MTGWASNMSKGGSISRIILTIAACLISSLTGTSNIPRGDATVTVPSTPHKCSWISSDKSISDYEYSTFLHESSL